MPGSYPVTRSVWRRTRYWTTLACTLAAVAGMLSLASGHSMHGALLLLAALVLFNGSVFGRRGRRHLHEDLSAAEQAQADATRKWRKAA